MKKNSIFILVPLFLLGLGISQVKAAYQSRFLQRQAARVAQDPAQAKRLIDQALKQLKVNPEMFYKYLKQVQDKLPMLIKYANQFADNADTVIDNAVKAGENLDSFAAKVEPLLQKSPEDLLMALKDEAYISKLPQEIQAPAREAQKLFKQATEKLGSLNLKNVAETLGNVLDQVKGNMGLVDQAISQVGSVAGVALPAAVTSQLKQLPQRIDQVKGLLNKLSQMPGISDKMIAEKVVMQLKNNKAALKAAATQISSLAKQLKPYVGDIKATVNNIKTPLTQLLGQANNLTNIVQVIAKKAGTATNLNAMIQVVRNELNNVLQQIKPQLLMVLTYTMQGLEKAAMVVDSQDKVQKVLQDLNLNEAIPAPVLKELNNLPQYNKQLMSLLKALKGRLK